MNESVYPFTENPSYHDEIRRIQNTDPVNAETIVNPLIEKMLENTQFVKNQQETHCSKKDNPHTVTKEQVGLGNVDNTADINKPVSTAVQTALNGKANTSHTHTKSSITDFPTSLPASDVSSWAKAGSKPSYSWSEIKNKPSAFSPSSHTHAATGITQDASHRFVTDSEKTVWNLKSNPNLLDNWYFADPINQREITTMTTHYVYTIDRFIFQNASGSGSLTVNTDSITLTAKDNDGLAQFTESPFTVGEYYTMSLLTKDGQLLTATNMCTEDGAAYDYPGTYWKWFLDKTHCYPIITYEQSSVRSLDIVAAKLEKGTQQTLARKEGSRWVLNDPPPNKALELLKCQRFYVRSPVRHHYAGDMFATTTGVLLVPLPVLMAKTPACNIINRGNLYTISGIKTVTTAPAIKAGLDPVGVKLVFENLPNSAIGPVTFADWSFEFSAEG